ncbi:MAG: dihydrodipicolinate synthase family protein [Lachnospiraceae bacterium]|uniref:dihydrodipicolinate synthase family protein n=1 Tax=Parablautia sp. Marseille-Q6255 TaxID=3039593 RepID=UPI0024BCBEDD|nr:dihydrodipicolinate synthase family protein [Parablautia sp. Marseille-Q6255]
MKHYDVTEIKGVIPANLTIFDEKENLDDSRTKEVLDFLLDHDADGFYLTGSTGACFTMTMEERMHTVETVINHVNGRKPVIVHVGDIGTKKSIELAKQAEKAGADAISSVPPFYWKFSQDDIFSYYRDISESVDLPMIVYNIALAGIMDEGLLQRIAQLDHVKGLKYTARSHDEMGFLKEKLGKDFMIYSGCDEMALSGFCFGADGIIGSFYNVIPDIYKKIENSFREGNMPEAIRLQKMADEFIFACLKYDFPSVLHNLLRWRGVDGGYIRRPFCNYEEDDLQALKEAIREIRDRLGAKELDVFEI